MRTDFCRAIKEVVTALGAVLLSVPILALGPSDPVRLPTPPWATEFMPFDDTPKSISYLISQRKYQTGTFLIRGSRRKDDQPADGRPLFGKPPRPGEWMIEDETGAICIKGLTPPEPGHLVVLAARFGTDPEASMLGIRLATAGKSDGTDVIRVGEFIHFPLSSTKSASSYPDFSGDLTSIEGISFLRGVILRGVKPGIVTIKVFKQWWDRPAPEYAKEFTLKVTGP